MKSSLTYPIIVFVLAIVAVIVMSVYVLPKFKDFYTSLDAKLPLPTRMLLGFTDFMANWWWLHPRRARRRSCVVGVRACSAASAARPAATRCCCSCRRSARSCSSIAIERFCRVLAALVHAGVSLPDAVQVSADSTNNTRLHREARRSRARR